MSLTVPAEGAPEGVVDALLQVLIAEIRHEAACESPLRIRARGDQALDPAGVFGGSPVV